MTVLLMTVWEIAKRYAVQDDRIHPIIIQEKMSVLHVQEMQELDRPRTFSCVFWMQMISGWR